MLENNLLEVDEDSERSNVPKIVGTSQSESSSETNTLNRDRKKNKKSVNFEPSKEASLDLDNILRERCKLYQIGVESHKNRAKHSSFFFFLLKTRQKRIYLIIHLIYLTRDLYCQT